jgi:hypothetical protein
MLNHVSNTVFLEECLPCAHSFLSLPCWLWLACLSLLLTLRRECSAMARAVALWMCHWPSREQWSRRLHQAAVVIAVAMTALVVIGALATPASANDLSAADLGLIESPVALTYAASPAATPATDTNPSGLFGGFSVDSAAGNSGRSRTQARTATLRQEPADYASPSPAQSKTLAPDLALARDYQDYARLYREYLDSLERSNQLNQRAAQSVRRVVSYAPSYQPTMSCADGQCSLSYGSGGCSSGGCSSGNCGVSYSGGYSSGGCSSGSCGSGGYSSGGCSSGGCSGGSCGIGFGRMLGGFRGGGCASCR